MRAWRLGERAEAGDLRIEEIPRLAPGQGEILVRVAAAGVTPTEMRWYPTTRTKTGERRTKGVPGHEFSGTVSALGKGAKGFSLGDEIYGMNDWFDDGATAEYCLTREEWIARRPACLSAAEGATVPIGALTAWQGLFERGNLRAGEKVLVHGGSGSVGIFAVQLAKGNGARVWTTASARNREYLLKLGAERVIDYQAHKFEEIARGMDLVFDCVGGEVLARSWGVLRKSGRMVTIADNGSRTQDPRIKEAFFIVEANGGQLAAISALFEAGKIETVVDSVVPFEQAREAYAGTIRPRLGRGKVVVACG